MGTDRTIYLGPRLRRLRRDLGLTQAVMAADLDISPSYVALLERNQRPLTADLLLRLATTYQIDLASLAGDGAAEAAGRLEDALKDPIFADMDCSPLDMRDVASGYPGVADALIRVYTAYREGQMALADAAGQSAIANDPVAEARRFLSARRNTFPTLDDKAQRLWKALRASAIENDLTERLEARHRISVRRLPSDLMENWTRRFDPHRGELVLDVTLDRASQRFQLSLQIAYLEFVDDIDQLLDKGDFETDNGRRLAHRALANYVAAAILTPYDAFRKAAEETHYDVEALSRRFGVSFEQAAHRLTTLQKPGQEGIPFFFIRVDAAGNVSKRLDGAGFPFARHGGSCPLWSLHQAFKTPRRIVTQWVELPDGARFFSIARTVTAGGGRHGAPRIERAIALGCAGEHAVRLIYAKDRDLRAEPPDPIGVTCRLCQRPNCIARAEPPIGRQVLRDDYRRSDAPFDFADN